MVSKNLDNMTRRSPLDQTLTLSKLTKLSNFVFGKNRKFQGGDYGNSILSIYEFIEKRHYLFTKPGKFIKNRCEIPQPNDYCQGISATLIKKDNFTFWFTTTHYGIGPNETVQYEESIQTISFLKQLKMISPNIIFTGDLNVRPNSKTIENLLSSDLYLKDLWKECKGIGDGFTFNARNPDRRIDYIFINFPVKRCNILVHPSQDSDHRPVYTTLIL